MQLDLQLQVFFFFFASIASALLVFKGVVLFFSFVSSGIVLVFSQETQANGGLGCKRSLATPQLRAAQTKIGALPVPTSSGF